MSTKLLDHDQESLAAHLAESGQPAYRARQVIRWLHHKGRSNPSEMLNLPASLRDSLTRDSGGGIGQPEAFRETIAEDGTRKWLFDAGDGVAYEAVLIPETKRNTLCISSQAGCALACEFCLTGRQGFARNLDTAEIIGQLRHAVAALGATGEDRAVTNVVMMGMGEPLLNLDPVLRALRIMVSPDGYGLSRRRVTVSTAGIVPAIDRLRAECPVALAVSLHAPDDELRERIMPINRKYPLRALLDACRRYVAGSTRDFVTFEYVMLDDVNDSIAHADKLAKLLDGVPSKVNLIPFNSFQDSGFRTSPAERILAFRDRLNDAGLVATIRKTRGDDISAACGQLAGQIRNGRPGLGRRRK